MKFSFFKRRSAPEPAVQVPAADDRKVQFDKPYVFGVVEEDVLIAPLEEARRIAGLWDAVRSSATWQDFAKAVGEQEWQKLQPVLEDYEVELEDDFDPDVLTDDGDWPDWIQNRMLEWVPQSVQEAFGDVHGSVLNGGFLEIPAEDVDDVASALKAAGIEAKRDDKLMWRASRAD